MHTISIRLDDSIYEHLREFLKFYPQNKLQVIEDEDDTRFTEGNAKAYEDALSDMNNNDTVNWKEYAKTRNIDV
ncbi:MAG TPA: hypothetical protein PKW30_02645 [Campylobacterales bacterium]|nr:hypothetical protein [Campylobacterales bacterium]